VKNADTERMMMTKFEFDERHAAQAGYFLIQSSRSDGDQNRTICQTWSFRFDLISRPFHHKLMAV
jgi:hypothetical protein